MERWAGRVAVVTGASAGIGEAVAKELVKQGMTVVGIARRLDRIQKLSNELSGLNGTLLAVKADLTNEKEVLDAFEWIEKNTSGIDVLVNNASCAEFSSVIDGTTSAWRLLLDLNVMALSICAREAIRSMRKKQANDAIIINICSISGHKVLSPLFSMYTASKFAVKALSESLQKELSACGSGIKVTNLSPGVVNTDSIKILNMDRTHILQPSDIVQAVVFILSVENRVHIPELRIEQNFEINIQPSTQ